MSAIRIENLIRSLNSKEISIIDDHIHSLAILSGSSDETKQLKYFRLVVEKKEISKKEISKSIGSVDIPSLKRHLSIKIYDALLHSKHIHNPEIFSNREQIVFDLKKKILTIKILYRSLNQGRSETIEFLLNETVKIAKKNEVFDVVVEALTIQKYFKSIRSGTNEFEKINTEICFYSTCLKAIQTANDAYYRLILNGSFIKSLSKWQLKNLLFDSIKQLEGDYKFTKSQEVNYYLHIIKMALFETEKNYSKAIKYCNKLIDILKKSQVNYRAERMGFILDNLCQFKIFNGKYKAAAKYAKSAQTNYIFDSFNYLISKEQEFYAYFYAGIYKNAFICTKNLLEHSLADTGKFRKSKFMYYQCCILFKTKKFKEALTLLNKSLEIEKDKTRWNISLRILNIMLFIELNKINEASISLESLRKYMERTCKNEEVEPRTILIVKLLKELEKDGFEYRAKNTKVAKMIIELSAKNKNNSWEHYTSELSPFNKWLGKRKIK